MPKSDVASSASAKPADSGSAASGKKTTAFLLDAPRLTHQDFQSSLDGDEISGVEEFEIAWYQFLSNNPHVLKPSKKLRKILVDIPNKIIQQQIKTKQVEMELSRQLDFFETSKEQLESNFNKEMESTALVQKQIQDSLNKEIDDVAEADQLLTNELPWDFFFSNIDELVQNNPNIVEIRHDHLHGLNGTGEEKADDNETSSPVPPLPSRRALYLAGITDHTLLAKAALMGRSSLLLKQAYAIDDALLESEVLFKQRQIQRLEKTIDSQKTLANFLSEHF